MENSDTRILKDYQRYTITAALPYANGPIHIGQLAGSYISPDIYVRYLRLKHGNEKVLFVCGSDEHGTAIETRAKKEGVSPQQIVDKYHELNKASFERLGIAFDIYHRTSSELHYQTASGFFTALYEKGAFEVKESEQLYDEEAGMFLADRYVKGTCPRCANESAYGDQCENCGATLSPTELINPVSTLSGTKPVWKKTKHWYLPLNKYEDWLKEWLLKGKGRDEEWKKNVLGQCKSWLEDGLQPRAMTRDLSWGVPVPLDDAEGKVLYVWLDAPMGYISATKQWAKDKGLDWKPYWQDNETKLVHFLGKDNIVFHCIIFPSILKELGEFIVPTNVPANEFMNLEGDKMSTSRNWTVWLHEYLDEFEGRQDELRYVLTAIMPETRDSEFTWKDYQNRVNTELVAVLGNFVNRVMVLTHKYFEGRVQPLVEERKESATNKDLNLALKEGIAGVEKSLESYRFREAMDNALGIARAGNKYLADEEPWNLYKEDEAAVGHVLNRCTQLMVNLAIVLEPFLPQTSRKILRLLDFTGLNMNWGMLGNMEMIQEGHQLNESELLIAKVEDEEIQKQIDKLAATKLENQAKDSDVKIKPMIEFEDFQKLDMRTGTILEASKVEGADKLLQLTVDLGFEKRTIVSGVADHYKAEDIIGQQVTVLINLKPRKIRGVESQGMILMAEDDAAGLKFLSPAGDMPNGSEIH